MKPDYQRTTITVPVELKERMKIARALVNWSAVACEAFEEKLKEIGPIEEITSIEGALRRMQAVQQQASSPDANPGGVDAGKQWAMNFATPTQLASLEGFRNQMSMEDWTDLMTSRDGFKELARCIEPARGARQGGRPTPKRRRSGRGGLPRHVGQGMGSVGHSQGWEREFWQSILDERPESPDFYWGFANGALEIWAQIKDQL